MYDHPVIIAALMKCQQADLLALRQKIQVLQQVMRMNPPKIHWVNAVVLFISEALIKTGTNLKNCWLLKVANGN